MDDADSAFVTRKADRLVLDGRVCFVRRFGPPEDQHWALYWVLGDSLEVHNITLDTAKNLGTCSCPSLGKCSHIIAALKVEAMVAWGPA